MTTPNELNFCLDVPHTSSRTTASLVPVDIHAMSTKLKTFDKIQKKNLPYSIISTCSINVLYKNQTGGSSLEYNVGWWVEYGLDYY